MSSAGAVIDLRILLKIENQELEIDEIVAALQPTVYSGTIYRTDHWIRYMAMDLISAGMLKTKQKEH